MNVKNKLIEVDKAFSFLSEHKGMNHAFMEYIAEGGVMLRSNNMPFVGKEAVAKIFSGDDTDFTLTWEPLFSDLASSGELGYTYGTYKLEMDNSIEQGTYVSIWKKDKNGAWKFILDSGNQGIGD